MTTKIIKNFLLGFGSIIGVCSALVAIIAYLEYMNSIFGFVTAISSYVFFVAVICGIVMAYAERNR